MNRPATHHPGDEHLTPITATGLTPITTPATPTTTLPMTTEDRALELAGQRDLLGTARRIGRDQDDYELFTVPSRSRPDSVHLVRVLDERRCACDCEAALHHRICAHVGAVIAAIRSRELETQRNYFVWRDGDVEDDA